MRNKQWTRLSEQRWVMVLADISHIRRRWGVFNYKAVSKIRAEGYYEAYLDDVRYYDCFIK